MQQQDQDSLINIDIGYGNPKCFQDEETGSIGTAQMIGIQNSSKKEIIIEKLQVANYKIIKAYSGIQIRQQYDSDLFNILQKITIKPNDDFQFSWFFLEQYDDKQNPHILSVQAYVL